jgi:hypothetical protein
VLPRDTEAEVARQLAVIVEDLVEDEIVAR